MIDLKPVVFANAHIFTCEDINMYSVEFELDSSNGYHSPVLLDKTTGITYTIPVFNEEDYYIDYDHTVWYNQQLHSLIASIENLNNNDLLDSLIQLRHRMQGYNLRTFINYTVTYTQDRNWLFINLTSYDNTQNILLEARYVDTLTQSDKELCCELYQYYFNHLFD